MIRLLLGVLFLVFTVNAFAQFAGSGSVGPTFDRKELFIGGQASGGGSPVTSCALGNQLDFSDATGCNLVWAGH